MKSNNDYNTWAEVFKYSECQLPLEFISPEPYDNGEIPFELDSDVRRNLFAMASTLSCDNFNEVNGTRLINIANKWEIEGKKFTSLENVQQFLKTYQNEQLI